MRKLGKVGLERLPRLNRVNKSEPLDPISAYAAKLEKELDSSEEPGYVKAGHLIGIKFVGVYADGTEQVFTSYKINTVLHSGQSVAFTDLKTVVK